MVHQSINDVVRNPTVSDIYEKKRGNKKATNLREGTDRERKIPEIQRIAANSDGGKKGIQKE